MQKQLINISTFLLVALTLLFGACKTAKQAVNNNDIQTIDTFFVNTDINIIDTINHNYNALTADRQITIHDHYHNAFRELEQMLEGDKPLNFKRAVFVTENAYFKDSLNYVDFNTTISTLVNTCKLWMKNNKLKEYGFSDSLKMIRNGAIFNLMKDTIFFIEKLPLHIPYSYNFNDFLGEKDWSNQFVVKLLTTGSGNCHSLPYLYKILANELNTEAYLSLAPNHIFLKHRSKEWGWYNTELTSGEFPTDAWVKASGYITIDAIRNGIYMDTLGQKESIALCTYDLAKGYLSQTDNYLDGFVINCCDLVLKHHPVNINAIILKAEILRKQFEYFKKNNLNDIAQKTFLEMQQLYVQGLKMGYREMPKEMYLAWLSSIREQKDKYINSKINSTFNTR